jgi:autotransporter-associated beta strand protein
MKTPQALVLGLLLAANTATAQTKVWLPGGTNNWNVATNWSPTNVPTGTGQSPFINNGHTAFIDSAVPGVGNVFVGQNANSGRLEIRTGGVLSSAAVRLGLDTRSGTLVVSGGTIIANEIIVGFGASNNTGGGTGVMNFTNGSVTISNSFRLGEWTNTSGTVNMVGGSLTSSNLNVGVRGYGLFTQSGGTSTITSTNFQIGVDSASNSIVNLSGTATMNASNATIQVGVGGSGTGGFGLFGGGTLNAAGVVVATNSSFTDLGGTLNVTGGITNNGAWIFSPSNNLTSSYSIGGSGGMTKNAAGVLTLNAASTYTGDTTLNQANIQLGTNNALPTTTVFRFGTTANARRLLLQGFNQTLVGVDSTGASGNLFVQSAADNTSNAPATLTLNVAAAQSYTFSGRMFNAGGTAVNSALTLVKSGSGTQVLSGDSTFLTYSGTTTVNAGVLEFSGSNSVASNSAITLGGGTVRFSGGGTRSNTITGSGNLEKSGANTLTLSGANSHSGNTTVNEGTLVISSTGTLTFTIGDTGTNNGLLGTGTTSVNGQFAFDLSAASTNTNATWTIVANTLTNSYGTNFIVTGFNGAGGLWTNTTNGVNYVFAQSNSVLSVQSTGAATPYDAWVAYWQGVDPNFTNTAGTANPDGDPFDNNEEFAFDGNPAVGTGALLTSVKVGTNVVFNYVALTNTNAVTYQVQNTTNLSVGPWSNSVVMISNSANQSGISLTNSYLRKEFAVPAAGREFYRVQATIAP